MVQKSLSEIPDTTIGGMSRIPDHRSVYTWESVIPKDAFRFASRAWQRAADRRRGRDWMRVVACTSAYASTKVQGSGRVLIWCLGEKDFGWI
jgi:hypothetical protein